MNCELQHSSGHVKPSPKDLSCFDGTYCTRAVCMYTHPNGRAIDEKHEEKGEGVKQSAEQVMPCEHGNGCCHRDRYGGSGCRFWHEGSGQCGDHTKRGECRRTHCHGFTHGAPAASKPTVHRSGVKKMPTCVAWCKDERCLKFHPAAPKNARCPLEKTRGRCCRKGGCESRHIK